ncbi:MAG: PIG-L family deacetylase [Patescibacteria group bacterium]
MFKVKNQKDFKRIYKARWFWVLAALVLIFIGNIIFLRSYASAPSASLNFMPNMPDPRENDTILIFAPHNDDEILGTGGYIAQAVQNGAKVIVVFITNGDGHHFTTAEEFRKLYPSASDYISSGYKRQDESKNALSVLGVHNDNIIFLGYPDRGIYSLFVKNWSRPYESPYTHTSSTPYNNSYLPNVSYTGKNLDKNIKDIIENYKPTIVLATSIYDRHSDHRATGEFVMKGVGETGSNAAYFSYLVHYRNFPSDSGLHKDKSITPPVRLTSGARIWYKFNLTRGQIDSKESAINKYKSQISDPFLKRLMQSFIRNNEIFYKGI